MKQTVMNNKPVLFSFLLIFLSISISAAPLDSIGVKKIDNKLHVRYLVSPGETIYGISTKFGVSVSDLMEINPELENGLKVGQVINIPYNPEAIKVNKKYDDNTIVHKVQPGETFYSLSKKYNTTVDELMKLNNIQLKAGQEIVVGYKNQNQDLASTKNNNSSTSSNTQTTNSSQSSNNSVKQQEVKKQEEVKKEVKESTELVKANEQGTTAEVKKETQNVATGNNSVTKSNTTQPTNTNTITNKTVVVPSSDPGTYPYDSSRKQVLIIPFDPYLYFSDADDEIAARSNIPRTKVRQIFRKRLNALLEAPGYENIHLLGGKAKDSLSDMNKIYSMVTYNYQQVVQSPYYKESEAANPVEVKKTSNKNWLERQKDKLLSSDESGSKYDIPTDYGSYFGVQIKNQDFYTYFNTKYSVDYYIFVSQFEVKTNYEHCLDRAAQNYDRTFTTHFSIFDSNGKQIAGNKFKTHYNSNSNYIYTIVADNVEKIANRILADLPPPNQQ
jgi:LysM repeat protein